jgi:hypothetical protein
MSISRAQMGSQLKGNRMKKPVKKKAIGGALAKFSPLAMLLNAARDDKKDDRRKSGTAGPSRPSGMSGPSAPSGVGGMKAGGKVSYMKSGGKVTRADGAVMKGRTKGKMC